VAFRNDGAFPVKAQLPFSGSPAFSFSEHNAEVTLGVGEGRGGSVLPDSGRKFDGDLRLTVAHNRYEDTTVKLVGECHEDAIHFEDLPEEQSEKHLLGECVVGVKKEVVFSVANRSPRAIRFVWKCDDTTVTISPSVGHIASKQSRSICLSVLTTEPQDFRESPLSVTMESQAIQYRDGEGDGGGADGGAPSSSVVDWDDRKIRVRWDKADGASGDSRAARKVSEVIPEPPFDVVPNGSSTHSLEVVGRSDIVKFEGPPEENVLKTTLMFQTRTFSFPLKNIGTAPLEFRAALFSNEDGAESMSEGVTPPADGGDGDDDEPFSVSPSNGNVLSGDSQNVTVRFAPKDVGAQERLLKISIPHVAEGTSSPSLRVRGASQCPAVHFEVAFSDYLTRERSPEIPGPGGVPGPLNPSTR
jgi:hydrocephalus-inducing protein